MTTRPPTPWSHPPPASGDADLARCTETRSMSVFLSISGVGALGFLLGVVVLYGLHDGGGGRADELLAVAGRPVAAVHGRLGLVLEERHDVLGEQLVGAQGGLAGR